VVIPLAHLSSLLPIHFVSAHGGRPVCGVFLAQARPYSQAGRIAQSCANPQESLAHGALTTR
jgi:hypothetical protein